MPEYYIQVSAHRLNHNENEESPAVTIKADPFTNETTSLDKDNRLSVVVQAAKKSDTQWAVTDEKQFRNNQIQNRQTESWCRNDHFVVIFIVVAALLISIGFIFLLGFKIKNKQFIHKTIVMVPQR
jgi:hypothetical protein